MNTNKIISVLTSACFLFSVLTGNLSASSKDDILFDDNLLNGQSQIFSSKFGKITDIQNNKSDLLVINIQDLHSNKSVQFNINDILRSIDKHHKIKRIFVEGGYGDIDVSWIDKIEDQVFRNKLVNQLMVTGRFTGAEYFAYQTKRTGILAGLENEQMHKENLARLSGIMDRQPFYDSQLQKIKADIDFLNEKYFSEKNLKLNRIIDRYAAGKINPGKFYRLLFKLAEDVNGNPKDYKNLLPIDFSNFPNINKYINISSVKINDKKAAKEINLFLSYVKQRLPYDLYVKIVKDTNNFSDINKLCEYIYSVGGPDLLKSYPSLNAFVANNIIINSINPIELLSEERVLINNLRQSFSNNDTEYEVSFLADFYPVFRDYLSNKITADNYDYFSGKIGKFKEIYSRYAVFNRLNDLAEDFIVLDKYYSVNNERNLIFVSRLLDNLQINYDDNGAISNKDLLENSKDVIAVISGGYHTKGLSRLLEDRKISYITVTPNVETGLTESEKYYRNIVKEQAEINKNALSFTIASSTNDFARFNSLINAAIDLYDGIYSQKNINGLVESMRPFVKENVSVNYTDKRSVIFVGAKRIALDNAGGKIKNASADEDISQKPAAEINTSFINSFFENNPSLNFASGLSFQLRDAENIGLSDIDGIDLSVVARFPVFIQDYLYERLPSETKRKLSDQERERARLVIKENEKLPGLYKELVQMVTEMIAATKDFEKLNGELLPGHIKIIDSRAKDDSEFILPLKNALNDLLKKDLTDVQKAYVVLLIVYIDDMKSGGGDVSSFDKESFDRRAFSDFSKTVKTINEGKTSHLLRIKTKLSDKIEAVKNKALKNALLNFYDVIVVPLYEASAINEIMFTMQEDERDSDNMIMSFLGKHDEFKNGDKEGQLVLRMGLRRIFDAMADTYNAVFERTNFAPAARIAMTAANIKTHMQWNKEQLSRTQKRQPVLKKALITVAVALLLLGIFIPQVTQIYQTRQEINQIRQEIMINYTTAFDTIIDGYTNTSSKFYQFLNSEDIILAGSLKDYIRSTIDTGSEKSFYLSLFEIRRNISSAQSSFMPSMDGNYYVNIYKEVIDEIDGIVRTNIAKIQGDKTLNEAFEEIYGEDEAAFIKILAYRYDEDKLKEIIKSGQELKYRFYAYMLLMTDTGYKFNESDFSGLLQKEEIIKYLRDNYFTYTTDANGKITGVSFTDVTNRYEWISICGMTGYLITGDNEALLKQDYAYIFDKAELVKEGTGKLSDAGLKYAIQEGSSPVSPIIVAAHEMSHIHYLDIFGWSIDTIESKTSELYAYLGQESISSEFGFNTYYSSNGQSVAGIGDGTDNYSIAFAVINKVEDVCGMDSLKMLQDAVIKYVSSNGADEAQPAVYGILTYFAGAVADKEISDGTVPVDQRQNRIDELINAFYDKNGVAAPESGIAGNGVLVRDGRILSKIKNIKNKKIKNSLLKFYSVVIAPLTEFSAINKIFNSMLISADFSRLLSNRFLQEHAIFRTGSPQERKVLESGLQFVLNGMSDAYDRVYDKTHSRLIAKLALNIGNVRLHGKWNRENIIGGLNGTKDGKHKNVFKKVITAFLLFAMIFSIFVTGLSVLNRGSIFNDQYISYSVSEETNTYSAYIRNINDIFDVGTGSFSEEELSKKESLQEFVQNALDINGEENFYNAVLEIRASISSFDESLMPTISNEDSEYTNIWKKLISYLDKIAAYNIKEIEQNDNLNVLLNQAYGESEIRYLEIYSLKNDKAKLTEIVNGGMEMKYRYYAYMVLMSEGYAPKDGEFGDLLNKDNIYEYLRQAYVGVNEKGVDVFFDIENSFDWQVLCGMMNYILDAQDDYAYILENGRIIKGGTDSDGINAMAKSNLLYAYNSGDPTTEANNSPVLIAAHEMGHRQQGNTLGRLENGSELYAYLIEAIAAEDMSVDLSYKTKVEIFNITNKTEVHDLGKIVIESVKSVTGIDSMALLQETVIEYINSGPDQNISQKQMVDNLMDIFINKVIDQRIEEGRITESDREEQYRTLLNQIYKYDNFFSDILDSANVSESLKEYVNSVFTDIKDEQDFYIKLMQIRKEITSQNSDLMPTVSENYDNWKKIINKIDDIIAGSIDMIKDDPVLLSRCRETYGSVGIEYLTVFSCSEDNDKLVDIVKSGKDLNYRFYAYMFLISNNRKTRDDYAGLITRDEIVKYLSDEYVNGENKAITDKFEWQVLCGMTSYMYDGDDWSVPLLDNIFVIKNNTGSEDDTKDSNLYDSLYPDNPYVYQMAANYIGGISDNPVIVAAAANEIYNLKHSFMTRTPQINEIKSELNELYIYPALLQIANELSIDVTLKYDVGISMKNIDENTNPSDVSGNIIKKVILLYGYDSLGILQASADEYIASGGSIYSVMYDIYEILQTKAKSGSVENSVFKDVVAEYISDNNIDGYVLDAWVDFEQIFLDRTNIQLRDYLTIMNGYGTIKPGLQSNMYIVLEKFAGKQADKEISEGKITADRRDARIKEIIDDLYSDEEPETVYNETKNTVEKDSNAEANNEPGVQESVDSETQNVIIAEDQKTGIVSDLKNSNLLYFLFGLVSVSVLPVLKKKKGKKDGKISVDLSYVRRTLEKDGAANLKKFNRIIFREAEGYLTASYVHDRFNIFRRRTETIAVPVTASKEEMYVKIKGLIANYDYTANLSRDTHYFTNFFKRNIRDTVYTPLFAYGTNGRGEEDYGYVLKMLKKKIENNDRTFRFWSCGAATGKELRTFLWLTRNALAELGEDISEWRLEFCGTDNNKITAEIAAAFDGEDTIDRTDVKVKVTTRKDKTDPNVNVEYFILNHMNKTDLENWLIWQKSLGGFDLICQLNNPTPQSMQDSLAENVLNAGSIYVHHDKIYDGSNAELEIFPYESDAAVQLSARAKIRDLITYVIKYITDMFASSEPDYAQKIGVTYRKIMQKNINETNVLFDALTPVTDDNGFIHENIFIVDKYLDKQTVKNLKFKPLGIKVDGNPIYISSNRNVIYIYSEESDYDDTVEMLKDSTDFRKAVIKHINRIFNKKLDIKSSLITNAQIVQNDKGTSVKQKGDLLTIFTNATDISRQQKILFSYTDLVTRYGFAIRGSIFRYIDDFRIEGVSAEDRIKEFANILEQQKSISCQLVLDYNVSAQLAEDFGLQNFNNLLEQAKSKNILVYVLAEDDAQVDKIKQNKAFSGFIRAVSADTYRITDSLTNDYADARFSLNCDSVSRIIMEMQRFLQKQPVIFKNSQLKKAINTEQDNTLSGRLRDIFALGNVENIISGMQERYISKKMSDTYPVENLAKTFSAKDVSKLLKLYVRYSAASKKDARLSIQQDIIAVLVKDESLKHFFDTASLAKKENVSNFMEQIIFRIAAARKLSDYGKEQGLKNKNYENVLAKAIKYKETVTGSKKDKIDEPVAAIISADYEDLKKEQVLKQYIEDHIEELTGRAFAAEPDAVAVNTIIFLMPYAEVADVSFDITKISLQQHDLRITKQVLSAA